MAISSIFAQPIDSLLESLSLPSPGQTLTVDECKSLACKVALRGIGNVSPNPLVGAVVVDERHGFVSAGAHLQVGEAHAEINALSDVPADLNRLIMYVTLEPCAHAGRTPSCAQTIDHRIQKVIIGAIDPNPKVSGQGIQILQEKGIEVEVDRTWTDCTRLIEIFHKNITEQRAFVSTKTGMTADFSYGTRGDSRNWITSTRSRSYGRFLRAMHDGVMVGTNTVRLDNPTLDCRDTIVDPIVPAVIVLDAKGELLKNKELNLRNPRTPDQIYWLVANSLGINPQNHEENIVSLESDSKGQLNLRDGLDALFEKGIRSIFVEGGGATQATLMQNGLVDRSYFFVNSNQDSTQNAMFIGEERFGPNHLKESMEISLGSDILWDGIFHGKEG